jgi:hypothetical protein
MRIARPLALLTLLATGTSAMAQESTVTTAEPPRAPALVAAQSLPWVGVMADAGLPDGMQGSLVLRPLKWFRTSLGGGYNMISKGVRAGATLVPWGRGPSGTLEVGRYFDGDANAAARSFLGAGFQGAPVLQRIGYDYVNAHLGLDFGYKRVTFYIHGGMSYVRGTIHNAEQQFSSDPQINGTNANGTQVSIKQDPTIKVIGPSAKIGLIVYLW